MPKTGVELLNMSNYQRHVLKLGHELRFEISAGSSDDERVHVWNSDGNVELFGYPLRSDRVYHFIGPASLGLLCLSGEQDATIHLSGKVKEGAYVATIESTRNHTKYLNLHSYLEKRRRDAFARNAVGPIVLIVGAPRSGKSSLCFTLLNYAVRSRPRQEQQHDQQPQQWTPVFADLDCCKPDLSLPGTLSMTPYVAPADPTSAFFTDCVLFSIPFGYTQPRQNNMVFYKDRVQYLAEIAHERMTKSRQLRASGMFVVAVGYRSGDPIECIVHTANAFTVSDILVMDNARLCHLLQHKYGAANSVPAIADVPKSKGVLESTDADEESRAYQMARLRSYFEGMGVGNGTRFPYPFDVPFADVKLCRIGVMNETVSSSMLSTVVDSEQMQRTLIEIPPLRNMEGHVFALMSAWNKEDVLKAGVSTFLVAKTVNMQAKTITFSSIRPKSEVPTKTHYLFYTELQYLD